MVKLDFPNRITIELTNQCNVSCSFCPRQKIPMDIGFMETELYKKIIDEAAKHIPLKLVLFFRGESLLHPKFSECLCYAKQKGIGPIQFATNALAMDEDIMDGILDGVDFISFSLDTLNPNVYKSTRQFGDLKKSTSHVIHLSEKCKERKKNGLSAPTLQVSTIELDEYINEQNEFISFWQKYVDVVRVYYEHDEKGGLQNKELLKNLQAMKERKPCRKVFTDFLIYWNGDIAICNYDWHGAVKSMNVKEMSIYDIWHSQEYKSIRRMHEKNTFPPELICRNCEHWRIDYMPDGYLGKMYRGAYMDE